MNVVGVCRFSLVGRGDWKAFRKKSESEIDLIAREQAQKLFTPERLEARLKTFELLTLASLRAQTDQDFRFIVLSSELMPNRYRTRLQKLCDSVPQVILRFFPIIATQAAQQDVFREFNISYGKTLQFRLDDDDCLCSDFVELMKAHTAEMMKGDGIFVASVKNVMYCASGGTQAGVYKWPVEFMSAGAAIRHPSRSIYDFGHFRMAQAFPKVVIKDRLSLVTHNGTNDTQFDQEFINRYGMERMSPRKVGEAIGRFFPFLTDEAQEIAGINDEPATISHPQKVEGPSWYSDHLTSKHRKGFFISDDHFALQHTSRSRDVLYVSFDNLASVRDQKSRDPWGYGLAAKAGWSNLGVMSYKPNWFRRPRLFDELNRLADDGFFNRYQQVIFSGTSMGGYAACAFSSFSPGSTVIAFSPQSTLNPKIASWDKRYPSGTKADWSGEFSDAATEISSAKKVWIIYDPKVQEDLRHAERLAGPNATLLKARYSSHFTAQYLSQIGVIGTFVRGCVNNEMTEQRFYELYRKGRGYRRYLAGLVAHAKKLDDRERQRKISEILRKMNKHGLANDLEHSITATD